MKPQRQKIPPRVNKLIRELGKLPPDQAGKLLRQRGVPEDDISLFFIGRAREALRA
ncbi:MAG TPA: hypothetical protein VGY48_15595 [Vicinamibacterales bacterium]|jgi:hypothetical protein|nr:hypothetical protein [Vicinamibacterales bacterium]